MRSESVGFNNSTILDIPFCRSLSENSEAHRMGGLHLRTSETFLLDYIVQDLEAGEIKRKG